MQHKISGLVITASILAGLYTTPVGAEGLAGPYLAASYANIRNDFVAASKYYSAAMLADESSGRLKQNAMVAFVDSGEIDAALEIARQLRAGDEQNVYADMLVSVDLVLHDDYAGALAIFPAQDSGISPMLWGLANGWLLLGSGDTPAALAAFDDLGQNQTIATYGQYHKALALAYVGAFDQAEHILAADGKTPLHLNIGSVIARAQILAELGQIDAALGVVNGASARGFNDIGLTNLRRDLESGKPVHFTQVTGPAYGISEALTTMAEAFGRDNPSRLALYYARLAERLRPSNVDAILSAAGILEKSGQFALAEAAYGRVPEGATMYKSANIGRAEVQRQSGDLAGATATLADLAAKFPQDVNVQNALGDIYRGANDYTNAIEAYNRTISLQDNPGRSFWVVYYARGISYERTGNWLAAEADFRRALELSPGEARVLNYIGYYYLEQNKNLEEAQRMIETAAAKMPNSGYIIDSLGWMYYRLGQFEQAVAPMERAVLLMPSDPVITDHYGDVLWMVGRKREARFQWWRSLSFNPAPSDAVITKRKLEAGLDVVLQETPPK